MSGTAKGGKKGAAKILARDPDFYKKIGAKGGKKGTTGGFAAGEAGRERARVAGAKGGSISRRGKKEEIHTALPGTYAADLVRDEEINEVAEQLTKDVMSFEQPKRPSFLDRFKKERV